MKLDIKTLVMLAGLAVAFGGFYYGTQLRLDYLESTIHEIQNDSNACNTRVDNLKKQVQRLSKKVNNRKD